MSNVPNVLVGGIGDIAGMEESGEPVAGDTRYNTERYIFDKICDEARVYKTGKRATLEITSQSQIQDFIIDMLGIRYEQTAYSDITDKF